MKKFKLVLLFFLLLLPLNVKAIDYENYCSYENVEKLKKIASNVNIKYDVVEKNKNVSFTVTLSNVHKELLIIDTKTLKYYTYDSKNKGEIKIPGYKSGDSITFAIYQNGTRCGMLSLGMRYVNLPTYNPYYTNKVCDGLEEYSLCQKWVKHGLTKSDFVKKVNEYKESLLKNDDVKKNDDIKGIFDYIGEFLLDYYIYILFLVIIGGVIGIVYLDRKDSFEFLK